jgi:K+-transporting ATPase ATPase B chain
MPALDSVRRPASRPGATPGPPARGPRRGQPAHRVLGRALLEAFRKLSPGTLARKPAMVAVLAGAVIALAASAWHPGVFTWSVTGWLALTVLAANFAEALAEGHGKAQADALRKIRSGAQARRLRPDGGEERIPAAALTAGDLVVCEPGDVIPSDGEVIDGLAAIDESAITGESAPVIRESGTGRCAVTGGTTVLSDRVVVRIAGRGQTFLDRMITLMEDAGRQRAPNEAALAALLGALAITVSAVVVTLLPHAVLARGSDEVVVPIALLAGLMPTTISALAPAIGTAGMSRLLRHNVLATSRQAVEAAGDVQTMLLDTTGTITFGTRAAAAFHPVGGHSELEVASTAQLASLPDETAEGRSIVVLAKQRFGIRQRELGDEHAFIPFSAQTRMSGLDLGDRKIRKGAVGAVRRWVTEQGGAIPPELDRIAGRVARSGATPLAVAEGPDLLGVIELKDTVKHGIRERFAELRAIGIRTVMITGDNPLTAAAIAQEAGVDGYLAEATPEAKMNLIKAEQAAGKRVAMIGDGANDAPSLAQADVGVAMNAGAPAARHAGNMLDLDSDPAKLIDIVRAGRQLLAIRSKMTAFCVASEVATYFAVIPALLAGTYPRLQALNAIRLHSPQSALLSAVIFNALVIIALIPVVLRGVRFRPSSAAATVRRKAAICGIGGLIAPFALIKLIDVVLTTTRAC